MSLQTDEEVKMAIDEIVKQMEGMGEDRPMPTFDDIFNTEYDIKIMVTDETLNKATMAQTLQNIMGVVAQTGKPIEPIMSELFDVLGFSSERIMRAMEQQKQPQLPGQQGIPQGGQLTAEQQAGGMQQPPMPGQQTPVSA